MSSPRQTRDPERYARTARFVADLGEPVLKRLAPRADKRILADYVRLRFAATRKP